MNLISNVRSFFVKNLPNDIFLAWVSTYMEHEWLSGMVHLVMSCNILYLLSRTEVYSLKEHAVCKLTASILQ